MTMVSFKTFTPDSKLRLEQRVLLADFLLTGQIKHYVVLETCDRLELFFGSGPITMPVIEHLASVTAGLKSPIIGEKAIQGQVKSTYLAAIEKRTINSDLHLLFQQALRCGKLVRHQTGLDRGSIGHGQITVNLLEQRQFYNVVIIGINEISKSILNYLSNKPLSGTILANRNATLANQLAQVYNVKASPLSDLDRILIDADCVISCTSAPHYLIRPRHFVLRDASVKKTQPLVLIDLSAPPDVDPACMHRNHIEYFDLAAIESISKLNQTERQNKANKAHTLLRSHLESWLAKQQSSRLTWQQHCSNNLEHAH